METLGARVRRLRLEADDMTQEALAAQVPGMSASAISQLENGNSKGVKPENLLHLAQALGVSMHELVTGKPDPNAARPSKAASTRLVRYTDPQEEKLMTVFRKLPADRRAVIVALALVLASCANTNFQRPGATAEDFRTDNAQCQVEANRVLATSGGLAGISLAESTRKACLEGKGWRPTT